MIPLDPASTISDLIRSRPSRARVFEEFGIDYCCGGKRRLDEACAARGLDLGEVLRRLEDGAADEVGAVDVEAMSLGELADHIETTHHAHLKRELPRLDFMARKVAAAHGDAEPRLHEIRRVFLGCKSELESHMQKEEGVLFPMIRGMERASGPVVFHCGSLANPIAMMEHEHRDAGDAMERLRDLTDGYTAPEWACNTYRAMVDGLAAFERDMHSHVHKENNVLFPRALRLESQLQQRGGDA